VSGYDPERGPAPESWLSLPEDERMSVVQDSIRADEPLPNRKLHAVVHVVVENQVAMGDETPVAATLRRLLDEGLGRHDAVHAIGSVLSKHVYRALRSGEAVRSVDEGDPNESYWRDLGTLNAREWRDSASQPAGRQRRKKR
jgi:hypothetical protein